MPGCELNPAWWSRRAARSATPVRGVVKWAAARWFQGTIGVTRLWTSDGPLPDNARHPFYDATTIFPDHVVARVSAIGALAGLIRRLRTGAGARIHVPQAEVAINQLDVLTSRGRATGRWWSHKRFTRFCRAPVMTNGVSCPSRAPRNAGRLRGDRRADSGELDMPTHARRGCGRLQSWASRRDP